MLQCLLMQLLHHFVGVAHDLLCYADVCLSCLMPDTTLGSVVARCWAWLTTAYTTADPDMQGQLHVPQ